MSGTIVVVPERQPLEAEDIWRVTLQDESFGRLVCRKGHGNAMWHLLQLDDLSDGLLDAYEEAMLEPPQGSAVPTS